MFVSYHSEYNIKHCPTAIVLLCKSLPQPTEDTRLILLGPRSQEETFRVPWFSPTLAALGSLVVASRSLAGRWSSDPAKTRGMFLAYDKACLQGRRDRSSPDSQPNSRSIQYSWSTACIILKKSITESMVCLLRPDRPGAPPPELPGPHLCSTRELVHIRSPA